MCGIVGIAGNINAKEKAIFKNLLTICQLRGRHSTGAITVSLSDKFDYVKRVGTPEFLLETKEYDRRIDSPASKALIGHCRAATSGVVNMPNAHPFEHGHICGVHNGTLTGVYGMEGRKDYDVDSDWLYWYISQFGIRETIPNIDDSGAWALVWFDENEKTLNFLKNKERPLFFTYSKDMNVMIWASEPWMLMMVERHIELWDGGELGQRIFAMPNDQLWSFTINGSGKNGPDTFTLKEVHNLKGKEVRSYSGNAHGYHGYSNVGFRPGVNARGGEEKLPFLLDDPVDDVGKDEKVVHLLPNRAVTPTPDGSTSTSTTTVKSEKSSANTSGQSTGSTSSSSTVVQSPSHPRPILSLSPSANKENSSSVSSDTTKSCVSRYKPRGHVSFRQVAGVWYITNNKTGREYSEHRFENLTDATCTFCRNPIGDIKEVHELFVEDGKTAFQDDNMRFICKSCVTPVYNS